MSRQKERVTAPAKEARVVSPRCGGTVRDVVAAVMAAAIIRAEVAPVHQWAAMVIR